MGRGTGRLPRLVWLLGLVGKGLGMRHFVLGLMLLMLGATSAQASERKVALIVANGDYAIAGRLDNPLNDARLIAVAAKRAGFEVTLAQNLTLSAFQGSLRDFRQRASGAQVAMVYYAGHGIEGAGKNWLIPTDAQLKSDLDLPYEAIDLDRVLEAISGAQVRMVVLDACRSNPFGRSWRASSRAIQRGLAGIEVDDVLVIYAAAPGQAAADGDGVNSPFAISLAKRLVEPDLPIQLLGGAIRDDLLEATAGRQRPFVSASIIGTPIYLVPRNLFVRPAEGTVAAQPPRPSLPKSMGTASPVSDSVQLFGRNLVLAEWKKAENRSYCKPLTFSNDGGVGGIARRAQFYGGWAVAFDLPGARSAYGVAGTGVRDEPSTSDNEKRREIEEWPSVLELGALMQPAYAGYGLEGRRPWPLGNPDGSGEKGTAYVYVGGQRCLYNVWSSLGRAHLELLLNGLRMVEVTSR